MARKVWGRGTWSFWDLIFRDKDDPKDPLVVEESLSLGEAPSGGAAPKMKTGGGGAKRDPAMSIIKRIGLAFQSGGGGGKDFEPAEFNMDDIVNAYNTEGYVRQAIDKYIEMIFKAGWDFTGKNPASILYVRQRFAFMAEATQLPTNQLFLEIAEDLVKFSNAIIAKARATDALPFGGMPVQGIGQNLPVAGYFPLNVGTMQIKRDKFGMVKGWQQTVEGADKPTKFKPDDIVHMYYKREKGHAFGTPFLIPALDDIRALRQIEENVLRLVYRNLHPLWHIKVGLEQEGFQADDTEVDLVRAEVENMDIEGGLVTSERVSVSAIASNMIIDATNYLKHFEQRAFTVMGMSDLLMGRGNTANRSTGDNISGAFIDRIKALQQVMSTFINEFMLKEVLMEGGFDPVLMPDDAVKFTFKEVDMDSQIKWENQAVYLYEHSAINENEMRERLGLDPQTDPELMYVNMVKIPEIEATAQAQAQVAQARMGAGGGGGQGAGGGGSTKMPGSKTKATDNKQKPANQHGVKSSPKKTTNAAHLAFMTEAFNEYSLLNDAVKALVVRHYKEGDDSHLQTIVGAIAYSEQSFQGLLKVHFGENVADMVAVEVQRMYMDIAKRCTTSLKTIHDISEGRDLVQAVFDVFQDRLGAISNKAFDAFAEKEVG